MEYFIIYVVLIFILILITPRDFRPSETSEIGGCVGCLAYFIVSIIYWLIIIFL